MSRCYSLAPNRRSMAMHDGQGLSASHISTPCRLALMLASCGGALQPPVHMPPPPLFAASLWLQKRVRVTKKYQAHDEQQQCSVGDVVVLAPSRPLSKTKRCALLHSLQWHGQ